LPEGVEGIKIKQAFCGKKLSGILTVDGQLFMCGKIQNEKQLKRAKKNLGTKESDSNLNEFFDVKDDKLEEYMKWMKAKYPGTKITKQKIYGLKMKLNR
jgi:alpha-tubulin suppressor-like RCC1 family protein